MNLNLAARPRSPILAPFVGSLHYHAGEIPEKLERVLPGGRIHLMVNLYENEFRTYHGSACTTVHRTHGAVLGGPSSQATVIDTREQRCLVSVDFKLGGAWPFFRAPLGEAQDQLVEIDQLWGRDGAVLRARLLEARTPERMFQVLEAVLLKRVAHPQDPDPAILFAARAFELGISVSEVTSQLGLLPKTFVRRFRAQTGLTPKRFSRVRRLQRVLGSLGDPSAADWSELAAEHGYTDQAHLIHDFRDLTGLTPTPTGRARRKSTTTSRSPARATDAFLQYIGSPIIYDGPMIVNRSAPPGPVVPVLSYKDVPKAIEWLCGAFGFTERLRTPPEPDGTIHHAQLAVGEGSVMLNGVPFTDRGKAGLNALRQGPMVYVQDVDAHCEHARKFGAKIVNPPVTAAFGERQCSAEDLEGYRWTFSQSVADVNPEDWGALLPEIKSELELLPRPRFCYLEIPAVDVHQSATFYEKVFGCNIRHRDTSRPSFDIGNVSGAWVTGRPICREPGLLPYIWVDGIDDVLERAASQSGEVVDAVHHDHPDSTSWIATFRDPAGNLIGLYQEAPR